MQNNNNVITYDYKTIKARREMESIICDSYQVLGWELTSSSIAESSPMFLNLSFKRNRKIQNKAQLLKAQEKMDTILGNIDVLQRNKKKAGLNIAILTGIAGTLIMGGGLSMIMTIGGIPATIAGVVLGVLGVSTIVLSHFLRQRLRKKTIERLNPILESEFEKLSEINEVSAQLQAQE